MKIGFDFDGVISSLNFWRIPKVIRRTFTAMQRSVAEKVQANQGALDLIHDLQKKGHQVIIITGRYRNVAKETAAWMKKHELPKLKIIYNPKELFSRDWLKKYKVSAVKRSKVDVYIEDQPELAEAIALHTKAEVVLHRGEWDETARDVMAAIRDIRKARKNSADIVGFDIDGVLTVTPPDHRERIVREGERYREFIQREGPPNVSMLRFVRELVKAGNEVHFITGRVGETALERTKVWFNKNGLADLVGNVHINREGTDPKDIRLDKRHKEKTINRLGVMEYYEDNAEIAEHLAKTTKAKIILYKTSRENPSNPMQIILSVPHAVGLPAATGGSGGMKGHDYIATEMAQRLAQRLGVPDSHLLIGDLPRDLMDLNRERNRWKAHFRAKLRNLIKQDPSNTIHLDVHSFRVNSKVYAGNDIAIVTTEKTPRPYEVDLLRFFADNGIRSKIYTEMLMDVVPEARELGAGLSVLLEFNEGTTPEQRDHYADLVAQFVRQKAGQENPFHEPPERSGRVCAKCGQVIGPEDDYVVPTTTSTWGGQTYYHRQCPKPNPERRPAPGENLHEPTSDERTHEMSRIRTMSMSQLELRMRRIRNPQKMYSFAAILREQGGGEYNRLADTAFMMLRDMGYDEQGRPITTTTTTRRRAPRRRAPAATPPPSAPASRLEYPPEARVWNDLVDAVASDILIHIGFDVDTASHENSVAWYSLAANIRERLSSTYNVKWNADGIIVAPATQRIVYSSLVTYRELEIGDIILDSSTEEVDRYVVVAHLGPIIDESSEARHGDETSVWGIWDESVTAAGREYIRASEGDLRPFIPGLMKRSDGDEAKYKVELKGIFRIDSDRWEHVKRHLEKRGTEVELHDSELRAWLYVPVNASEYHDEGDFVTNAEVGGRRLLLASSHPEIGLHYGDGTVVPVLADIRLFDIETYLPHRVDLKYRGSDLTSFTSVTLPTVMSDKFNVRSAGMVANPTCVLCNDLQTPHVYYEDQFIIICKDIKGKKSLLGLLKRHAKKPAKWEEMWLMRMLHFIAGEVFRNEFSVEKTMRTEPSHWHVHAVGNPSR